MRAYAIVLGGGSGRRMGAGSNKVFLPLRGVPVIVRALAPFTGLCAGAVAVAAPGEEDLMRQTLRRYGMERFVLKVVCGGAERQQSVAAGLDALPADAEAVLVHDGARPLLRQQTVRRVLESVALHGTGIAAVPLVDTVKRAQADGCVLETLPLETYRSYSELFDNDLYHDIDLTVCVEKRISEGGTSAASVDAQIAYVKEQLGGGSL